LKKKIFLISKLYYLDDEIGWQKEIFKREEKSDIIFFTLFASELFNGAFSISKISTLNQKYIYIYMCTKGEYFSYFT
jgi:hypothetical protein